MYRVVICEDDGVLAADVGALVEEAGHEVAGIFASARQALAVIARCDAQVAIIDLGLADGDTGAEVARVAASLGMRVIILSGSSNVGHGLGATSYTYAQKPWGQSVIRHLLSAHSTG